MNPKERLIKDMQATVSRYLALFESDRERLRAAKLLANLIERREVFKDV